MIWAYGTGILAIAAAMKGAKRILALDTDKNALKNAIENIKLNGVARSRIMVRLGSTDSSVGDTYDIIFANIQSSILRTMLLNLKEPLIRLAPLYSPVCSKQNALDSVRVLKRMI